MSTITVGAAVMALTAFFVVHRALLPVLQDYGGAHYRAAEYLNWEGVRPGEAVAIIGDCSDEMIWARLAGVRIVAQIPFEDSGDFWRTTAPGLKADVYHAFASAGARAVLTEEVPLACPHFPHINNTQLAAVAAVGK